jgi:glutathione synthase
MKIGFLVNDVATEKAGFSTVRLACEAVNQGHDVFCFGVGDLAYDTDEYVRARARTFPKKTYASHTTFFKDLQGAKGRHGVIVVNDPNGLAKAGSKMYLQLFPEEARPRTLITRYNSEIKAFAKELGTIVLKPLQGSGGASVFLVRPDDMPNLNQMIDAVSRDGYVIAQEYLPAAAEGDTRLFMMNGRPLKVKGKYAAFRRVRTGGDMRSNIHAGGKLAAARITDEALRMAEIVRPKLVQDGMFLVGLDIVGDKLMEINVFSPGGLGSAQKFTKVNFCRYVIEALQRKVDYMEFYGRNFGNVEMSNL